MWYKNKSEFYGFTQDPKTLDYMIVTNNENSFCSNCFEPFIDNIYKWCKKCNAKSFEQNFSDWTSENEFINKFIQTTQLNAKDHWDVLEWIPYYRLKNIKGESSTVYKIIWLDGPIKRWSYDESKWIRYNSEIDKCYVELHSLNESSNLSENSLNEV